MKVFVQIGKREKSREKLTNGVSVAMDAIDDE